MELIPSNREKIQTENSTFQPNCCEQTDSPRTQFRVSSHILLCMASEATDLVVWIGVAGVVPRDRCELLSPGEGAYVNFLTLAASESEYRAKVIGALSYYRLDLLGFEYVRPLSASDCPSEDIVAIAEELEESGNPQHVRYATFNTFPRQM